MTTTSSFPQRLRSGEQLFGSLVVSPSPRWADAVRGSGLDFIFIDTEHIALGRHDLSAMCQMYGALGFPPVVRITSPNPYEATMALDGGAVGVVAPYVETVEQAKALRGAVKLRPLKGAILQRILDGEKPEPEMEAYMARAAASRALILNIESVPALENLDKILAVQGIDGVLIGPHDLSCSLGIPEQYSHPRFREAARTIFQKARAAGVGAGIHFWENLDLAAEFIADGANLYIHSSDIQLFAIHVRRETEILRRGTSTPGSTASVVV